MAESPRISSGSIDGYVRARITARRDAARGVLQSVQSRRPHAKAASLAQKANSLASTSKTRTGSAVCCSRYGQGAHLAAFIVISVARGGFRSCLRRGLFAWLAADVHNIGCWGRCVPLAGITLPWPPEGQRGPLPALRKAKPTSRCDDAEAARILLLSWRCGRKDSPAENTISVVCPN